MFMSTSGDPERPDDLGRRLTELDWDMQPKRDLWPDISSRIHFSDRKIKAKARPAWLPFAMAASVVVATVSLVFSTMSLQRSNDADKYATTLAMYQQAQIQLIDQQHQMVRVQFSQLLERERDTLSAGFITEVENLMMTVDQASAEIKKAMAAQPNDPDYASMLVRTYQQELKFLNKVTALRVTSDTQQPNTTEAPSGVSI